MTVPRMHFRFHRLQRVRAAAVLLGLAVLAPSASAKTGRGTAAADLPRVVATNTILADITRQIAGDRADITCLVPPGADPHGFDPRPADVAALAHADIILANGAGLEPWLNRLFANTRLREHVVTVTDGCRLLTRLEHAHDHPGHSHAGEIDPHAWQDPQNGIIYAQNILEALIRAAPQHATHYRRRADLYIRQLRALDAWARRLLAQVLPADRRIVTAHDSLRYLGNAYHIDITPIYGLDPHTEPDASSLSALIEQLKDGRVHVLFLESTTNPKFIERLTAETGAVIGGSLHTGSIGPADSLAGSYLGMLRENILTLLEAFDRIGPASAPQP